MQHLPARLQFLKSHRVGGLIALAAFIAALFVPLGSAVRVEVEIADGTITDAQFSRITENIVTALGSAIRPYPGGNYGIVVTLVRHYSYEVPYGTVLAESIEYSASDGRYEFRFAGAGGFKEIRIELFDRSAGRYELLDSRELRP